MTDDRREGAQTGRQIEEGDGEPSRNRVSPRRLRLASKQWTDENSGAPWAAVNPASCRSVATNGKDARSPAGTWLLSMDNAITSSFKEKSPRREG